jgi:hypothetical protein
MEALLIEDGAITFQIEFENIDDNYVSFSVYESVSFHEDNVVADTELYLKGDIKWDGCSNFWFTDGLHLCGKAYFETHKKVMGKIWDVCTKKIKGFDSELARGKSKPEELYRKVLCKDRFPEKQGKYLTRYGIRDYYPQGHDLCSYHQWWDIEWWLEEVEITD